MKLLSCFLTVLCFQSCGQQQNTTAQSNAVSEIDTSFLKQTTWEPLNKFISIHTTKPGYASSDTSIPFKLTPIASYSYGTNAYSLNADSSIDLNLKELRAFLSCDTFSARKEVDYLFKVSSEIAYQQKPELLETIFIRPSSNDNKKINLLIKKLKEEKFIKNVVKNSSDSVITATISLNHADLEDMDKILQKLRSQKNVSEVFFTDLFTGQNKQELFYRITTGK